MMKRITVFILIILLISPYSFCQNSDTIKSIPGDIDRICELILNNHPNPFSKISRDDFLLLISELKENTQNMSTNKLKIRLAQIISLIGDSHTSITVPVDGLFPISFYWFDDGIYVMGIYKDKSEYLGYKLNAINNIPINEVIDSIATIVSHENKSLLKHLLPNLLVQLNVLNGFGLTKNSTECTYQLTSASGEIVEFQTKAINLSELRSFFNQMRWVQQKKMPLSKKNNSSYWYEIIDNNHIYIEYSRCIDMPDYPFEKFSSKIESVCDSLDITNIIIDVRRNSGGNSGVIKPLIDMFKEKQIHNSKFNVTVLIGRSTFSSAILNSAELKDETNAYFIGEPTGGKPNHFGEIKKVTLENIGLKLSYSTKYFKVLDNDDPKAFFPDKRIPILFQDYINGIDRALEYSLKSNNISK